jgi:sterol desaturase/sphingolipid hydroxylase (fatty acid hydroxylase superfamily)
MIAPTMDAVFIAAAVPIFFLLIGIELLVARRRGVRVFDYFDSVANLSSGIGQLLFAALTPFLTVGVYTLAYEKARVATLPAGSALTWIVVFLGADLSFYWFHRASHRVNFLWAIHAVHHQSEEYNYTVALRQAWLEPAVAGVFHVPFAILGVPPAVTLVAVTLNTLYQFFTHTRLVGKLGSLELVLNTPSHHRVHHGRNPLYIDRNYAGMFIVLDRVFGTYVEEREEPAYGVVRELRSVDPLWANLKGWAKLGELFGRARGLGEKLAALVGPPEWLPAAEGGRAVIPEVPPGEGPRHRARASRGVALYVGVALGVLVVTITGILLVQQRLTTLELVVLTAWFVAAFSASARLVEGRRGAVALEVLRLAAAPAIAAWIASAHGVANTGPAAAAAGVAALSAVGLAIAARSARTSAAT